MFLDKRTSLVTSVFATIHLLEIFGDEAECFLPMTGKTDRQLEVLGFQTLARYQNIKEFFQMFTAPPGEIIGLNNLMSYEFLIMTYRCGKFLESIEYFIMHEHLLPTIVQINQKISQDFINERTTYS